LKRWEKRPARRPDGLASSREEKAKPFRAEDPEVLASTCSQEDVEEEARGEREGGEDLFLG
jgi:hypothetical protein